MNIEDNNLSGGYTKQSSVQISEQYLIKSDSNVRQTIKTTNTEGNDYANEQGTLQLQSIKSKRGEFSFTDERKCIYYQT